MNQFPLLRVRGTAAVAVVVLVGALATPVVAQYEARLTGGASVFSFRTSGSSAAEFSPIARLSAGIGLAFPLRSGLFVRPELTYSVRGADIDGPLYDGSVELEAVSEISSIEIPVMLGYTIPVRGSIEPRVFAGPVFSYAMDALIRYRAASGGAWFTEADASVERYEVGVGFGAEVVYPIGGQRIVTGARGLMGLSRAVEPDPDRENPPTLYHAGVVTYIGFVF